MSMTDVQMLPCPFCGGTDIDAGFSMNGAGCIGAGCYTCSATGPDKGTRSADTAAHAWNQRAQYGWRSVNTPPPAGLLVVAEWAPRPPDTYQTMQVAFFEHGQWFAWHYGCFAARLVPPFQWACIAAPGPTDRTAARRI